MRGDIEEAIDENKYNHITSTYYLLAHRSLQIEDKAKRTETSLRDVSMPITVQSGTSILPQSLGKSKTYFGTSPPCQQASLSPSYHPSLHMSGQSLQNESDVGEDSSPSSSSSSLYHSANYLHHSNRGDRKMSPPFPREHLTITPRHGFSVAKGGIDTLIEEEERSRSQTTTDDEEDESITSAHIIHPAQIASSWATYYWPLPATGTVITHRCVHAIHAITGNCRVQYNYSDTVLKYIHIFPKKIQIHILGK